MPSRDLYAAYAEVTAKLRQASAMLNAHAEIALMCNAQPDGMSAEQIEQRKLILTVLRKLIMAERDKAIDGLCAAWTRYKATGEAYE